ncbi:MAG: preprotein translocase subunit YajC [Candidatus Goldbacteria bacterium]|nr:preprotein translocase subunit YajC [Candidatus Goldiibacteriota bacterium]
MFVSLLFAAENVPASTPAAAEGPSMLQAFLPLIIIFVLFYFMFIIPNKKEQKKHQEMLKSLKIGDKIITSGGIIGVIDKINDTEDIIRIKSGENTLINIKRSYIASKLEKPSEELEKK